jgi:ubiquitin-protein ligase
MVNAPKYDFTHPIFRQRPNLKRLAHEHLNLASMKSDFIEWQVLQTTDLDIPVTYQVTYHIRSIVGIDGSMNPIYGNRHVAEMSLGPLYPLEPCKVYMKTDLWHPNVKWDGRMKGRVCSNVDKFGVAYDLYGLVLWVGEILQYKNYHAKNEPPFPEDLTVAEWVLNYAEPHDIVNKEKGIFVDETHLLQYTNGVPKPAPVIEKAVEPVAETQPEPVVAPVPEPLKEEPPLTPPEPVKAETTATPADEDSSGSKFRISLVKKGAPQPPPTERTTGISIKINPR